MMSETRGIKKKETRGKEKNINVRETRMKDSWKGRTEEWKEVRKLTDKREGGRKIAEEEGEERRKIGKQRKGKKWVGR